MSDWIERAEVIIDAEVLGVSNRDLKRILAVAATEHEQWLCERLNGLTFFASAKDVADAFGLEFEVARGFTGRGTP